MAAIMFEKTGQQIKAAVEKRRIDLQQRLDKRNQDLAEFLKDTQKVRSYMIRSAQIYTGGHGGRGYVLYSKDDISSEEQQEISQLCQRIFEIEQELHRLALISKHRPDDEVFALNFENLIGYGFEA